MVCKCASRPSAQPIWNGGSQSTSIASGTVESLLELIRKLVAHVILGINLQSIAPREYNRIHPEKQVYIQLRE